MDVEILVAIVFITESLFKLTNYKNTHLYIYSSNNVYKRVII